MSRKMDRQIMCGLGVVIEELEQARGYLIHLDNESSDALKVDFDFGGSDNLKLKDEQASNVQIMADLSAQVNVPPNTTPGTMRLALAQVDQKKNIELRLQATPAEEEVPIELECKVILTATSLAGVQGYDLKFTNPTSEDITLDFNFSKSENLRVVAQGETQVDGFMASVSVAAGTQRQPFVILQTVDPSKQIAMEYSLTSYPTKDANPVATRDPLKCGAFLTLLPLPKAGGYEFKLENPVDAKHVLKFDFSNSANLELATCGAVGVTLEGTTATVELAPHEELRDVFTLQSVDRTKGIQVNYTLSSESFPVS
eukprot:TRINITY_DN22821_c0_g1_i1.p1 TRINITY_DN22821_c0_g1~~TRINITY_DN22821_c0_g1_i1.p1  ORF type:complete len:313 (-),score=86.50 TRINITY_DN22821_c0_g1_i1:482-1420(-)